MSSAGGGCVAITFLSFRASEARHGIQENKFWIPAFAGMTTFMLIPAIATQSAAGEMMEI